VIWDTAWSCPNTWLVLFDTGRLIDLFPGYDATATDFGSAIWLLYAPRQHLPRRIRVVINFLKKHMQQLGE
jgi:DNA-binding transcriptional LysR family regulator